MSRYEHPAEARNTAVRRQQSAADLEAANAWLAAEVAAERRAQIRLGLAVVACGAFCFLVVAFVAVMVAWAVRSW